ncbi:MAG: aminotransferase class I/II-fold pyridoxal phosphate-dependent enzyme [Alphaproteobacteria bacterium]
MRRELVASGVAAGELCVTNGAIDAIDRLLAEHLRPGDRVAVEDPGFTGILDLVMSRGLSLVPVEIDEEGPLPERLQRACAEGARAFIVTPRVQSPTGAALSEARARELRRVLRGAPDLLVIEDDHANRIADTPLYCLHDPKRARWAHVHSFSKSINPDLRMALMTGDDHTMARVQDRLIVGERWVSHLLQRIAYALLSDPGVRRHLRRAAATYTRRREALLGALRGAGFSPWGRI